MDNTLRPVHFAFLHFEDIFEQKGNLTSISLIIVVVSLLGSNDFNEFGYYW